MSEKKNSEPTTASSEVEQTYFLPDSGKVVKATSQAEAIKKAKEDK